MKQAINEGGIRIVSPWTRAKDHANIEDTQPKDIIEIHDRPIYAVDPKTYQLAEPRRYQQFLVGSDNALTPYR